MRTILAHARCGGLPRCPDGPLCQSVRYASERCVTGVAAHSSLASELAARGFHVTFRGRCGLRYGGSGTSDYCDAGRQAWRKRHHWTRCRRVPRGLCRKPLPDSPARHHVAQSLGGALQRRTHVSGSLDSEASASSPKCPRMFSAVLATNSTRKQAHAGRERSQSGHHRNICPQKYRAT